MPGNWKLEATWNLDPLPAADQPSLAYLLVDITQGTEGASPSSVVRGPSSALNLSLVLDTSGSMAGAKLQNLKQAVRWVVEHLSPQDSIAVTLFDDEVHPLSPSTKVADAQALLQQIDAIREAGGTAMSKGLLIGLDEALKAHSPGITSRIIVLTDGQTWGDADRCKELAAQAGAAGIPITALGVGAEEDWSLDLLDDMAAESGGLVSYIARPEEISTAFEGTVLAMQQTVARNLRLTLTPAKGVGVRAAYRVAPVISKVWPPQTPQADTDEGGEPTTTGEPLTLPLGDVQESSGQTLLYEVLLPPRRPGQYRLAQLSLKYELTGRETSEETTLDLAMSFAPITTRGPGNPRVMNSVEKATTFKLQTRALQASMLGDVANATRNLRAAATRLLNMGETELAEATEQEAARLESGQSKSSAGTKKLAFDTRKLAVEEIRNQVSEISG